MAHACACFYNGYLSILAHPVDKDSAATRNNKVDKASRTQHGKRLVAAVAQQYGAVGRNTRCLESFAYYGYGRGIGGGSLVSAFQHTGATGLETQGENIKNHIGSRLEYNAYHAEWHRNLAHKHAVRPLEAFEGYAKWRRQRCHLAHTIGDGAHTFGREKKAVVAGIGGVESGAVGRVSLKQLLLPCLHGVGQRQQYLVGTRRGYGGYLPRSFAGLAEYIVVVSCQVHCHGI